MTSGRTCAVAAAALLFLAACSMPALAYDQNIPYTFTTSPTAGAQSLQTAITQLASQTATPDPQLQSLAGQFANSLASGNPAAEASALSQLQAYPNLAAEAPALAALLKSLTINSDGSVSINPGSLSSALGAATPNPNGVPSALTAVSPQLAAQNMNTLMSLLNGLAAADPALVGALMNQLMGDLAAMALAFPNLSFPNLGMGSLPGFGKTPLSAPGAHSIGALSPAQTLESLAIPAVLVAAAVTLFLFRNRLRALFSGQALPGGTGALELDEVAGDSTPRNRVLRAFNRALRAMSFRGAVKRRDETHREFSQRCSGLSEGSKVRAVSGYYEKAKFSASEVTEADAAGAESEASALEASPKVK